MLISDDEEYFRSRVAAERRLEAQAVSPEIANIHALQAREYEVRIRQERLAREVIASVASSRA